MSIKHNIFNLTAGLNPYLKGASMKRLSQIIVYTLMTMMLAGSTTVNAISPGQGLTGSQNEVLSRVSTFAGNGAFAQQEGKALSASFRSPYSIVTLPDGSVLVAASGLLKFSNSLKPIMRAHPLAMSLYPQKSQYTWISRKTVANTISVAL
jgi:hypothetical protein